MYERKIYPKKSLGQNYLIDENICRKIVDCFEIKKNDPVLEIGAGRGELTKYIIEKTSDLTVVELDKNNCKVLEERFPGIKIINKDFLKMEISPEPGMKNVKLRVIGNIPYNITTEIVFKLIDCRAIIRDAQLMVQQEVAARLAGRPNTKEYGIPSVFVQVFSRPELRFKVSGNCFYPKPRVDSRIIYFDFSASIEDKIKNVDFFKKFVKSAFGMRRKTLRNSLKKLDLDLGKIKFDFSRRAESLSIHEFIELSNLFC